MATKYVYRISNEELDVTVNSFGAEISSIKDKAGTEYLWCGDAKYWNRQSPVLFPFVGLCKNKSYFHEGKNYEMTSHGFARDMEFEPVSKSESEIWLSLSSNDDTLKKYPFEFELKIGYALKGRSIKVMWKVLNKSDGKMPFSIGGHPAFYCPLQTDRFKNLIKSDFELKFDTKDKIKVSRINMDNGLVIPNETFMIEPDNEGYLKITDNMFDHDALVIEDDQVHRVALCYEKKEYVTVEFSDMPLCGIWSPVRGDAPFICIEPWLGRCDSEDFEGDIFERKYENIIDKDECFEKSYTIIF